MSSISPMNALSNILNSNDNALLGATSSASAGLSSLFSQAMSEATTPAQKAQVDLDETQLSDLNTLYAMSDPSSASDNLSSIDSLASLLGGDNSLSSTPSWETTLADLLGPDSTAAQALNLDQQASLLSQSMLNGDLGSLGSDIDSLV